jgi:surface antigen
MMSRPTRRVRALLAIGVGTLVAPLLVGAVTEPPASALVCPPGGSFGHCVSPTSPTPSAKRGKTAPANNAVKGQCVWYALERFHQATGVYPLGNGDAWNFANSTGANGWTVSTTPRVRSVAVFPPGVNGAGPLGHVSWVEKVNGSQIYVAEMNFGLGQVGKESHRWLTPAGSVRYVYAP